MSVSTLLGMPMAKGLFAKAIAQSGGPVGVLFEAGTTVAEDLAEALGRSAAAGKSLINRTPFFPAWRAGMTTGARGRPVIVPPGG